MDAFEVPPDQFETVKIQSEANPPDGPVVYEIDESGLVTVRWRSTGRPTVVHPPIKADPDGLL